MLGKRRVAWVLRLLVVDASTLILFFVVAYELRALLDVPLNRPAAPLPYYLWLLTPIVVVWVGPARFVRGVWRPVDRPLSGLALRARQRHRVRPPHRRAVPGTGERDQPEHARLVRCRQWPRPVGRAWPGPGVAPRGPGHRERWARVALVVGTGERAARVIQALHRVPRGRVGGPRTTEPRCS